MELLVVAVVAAIVVLVVFPFPIYSHGGFYPFEGVESADQVDRDSGTHPVVDRVRESSRRRSR